MQLLCDLVGKFQTSDGGGDGYAQLRQTVNLGLDQIGVTEYGRSKIDLDSLLGTCLVLHRDLDAKGICLLHVARLRLDSECELVEADFQHIG